MIVMFTYNREEMCKEALRPLAFNDVLLLIDQPKGYEAINQPGLVKMRYQRNMGKENFWQLWAFALERCEESNDEMFIFMPDDFLNLDLERVKALHERLNHLPYLVNLINDGRKKQWTFLEPEFYDSELELANWCDCGFMCNKSALEAIGFNMHPILKRNRVSSGVGEQLTRRFNNTGVLQLRPYKSLAFHGEHESVMHKEERKINPLISLL